MKARVKATGEIVEVKIIDQISEEDMYVEKFGEMSGRVFHITELDFDNLDDPDYWTRLEHQYAGMAMQGILSNPESELDFKDDETLPQALAGCAAKIATALVEKLKSESNGKQEDKEQQAESRYPFGDTSSGHETNESDRIV